jgi:hypothetical protein
MRLPIVVMSAVLPCAVLLYAGGAAAQNQNPGPTLPTAPPVAPMPVEPVRPGTPDRPILNPPPANPPGTN